MRKINQLDLFSGIGGFHLGFEKAGYKVKSYFSEVDKHAIAVYKHKFKDAEYVGSVTDVRGADLPSIDLITFGSPCQDFSLAGKRKGMGGERSSLILEAIRLIGECRPRVFIWENVKGTFSSNSGEDFAAILQAFADIGGYRLEWQLLNTSWFLPQNRERIYLVGYSTTTKRNWRGVFPISEGSRENTELSRYNPTANTLTTRYTGNANGSFIGECEQPTQEIKIGTWRTHKDGQGFREVKGGDCPTIPARAREDGSGQPVLQVKSATKSGYETAEEGDSINLSNPNSETRRGRVGKGKAQTLETSCNQAVVQPNYEIVKQKVWVRKHEVDIVGLQTLLRSHKSKSNKEIAEALNQPITKVEHWFRKDRAGFSIPEAELWNDLKTLLGITSKEYDAQVTEFVEQDGKYDQAERVYNTEGLAPTLTLAQEVKIKDTPNYRIRRLTPIECERLQGFPDNHTEYGNYDGEVKKMSNTQRYKQCGNAVTTDVVQAIAEKIKPLFK